MFKYNKSSEAQDQNIP